MLKIASVIVDNTAKEVDREFDYLIPSQYADILKVGMRVIVPFGGTNKYIEGYILNIKNESDYPVEKLKSIQDIVDKEPFFSIDIIELAYFLREKYNCTLSEAFKTIMPSGVSVKENLFVRLVEGYELQDASSYKQITQALSKDKYININQLNKILDFKVTRAQIFKMDSLGILEVKREMKQNTNIKTVELYSIVNLDRCIDFIENHSPRLRRQAEVLEGLIEDKENSLTMTEICEKFKCTRNVIKALEEKEFLIRYNKELYRNPFNKQHSYDRVKLTDDQEKSIENIIKNYKLGKNITLIHGVTGCGKTEIYLNLVDKFMAHGFGAIILVPEIALTPQTVERFRGRFGDTVAVIHSKLSDGERFDQWRRIKSGEVKVVVGARSGILAPVKSLKLIVIDEEHEYSYKSEVTPKYLTREVAEFRIGQNNGLLVLGSATPSIESYYRAINGRYNLVHISRRIGIRQLPEVKIVDMKNEILNGNKSMFSIELYTSIEENLNKNQQTILFLNRRGYSTFVSCRACGYVCRCSHCDVSLTYHIANNKLSCHYCGSEASVPTLCPRCKSKYIKYFGSGTEKIESEIKRCFPNSRVLRMDMDTTRRKGEHERIYNEFKSHKADILIGTQMVTKGMDFPGVTLVGVISADTTLNLPDFRSSERTFQLLTQVSGRAGRGLNPGRVVVQTYDPENYSITFSKKHDYISFFNHEISIRKALNNPPFTDILYILFASQNEEELIKSCMDIKEELKRIEKPDGIEALGPSPCHISKIKNIYRWHMIFKGDVEKYRGPISNILFNKLGNTNISYSIDINPYNMF